MFQTIANCFKVKEIRRKIWITLLFLLIFLVGCYIPVPGIDSDLFGDAISGNDFMSLMSSITGGSLNNATLFALGISPYINATIIMQLLTVGIPALERMSKQGEEGRKRIALITRFVTIALAIAQAIGIIINFGFQNDAIDLSIFGYSAGNFEYVSELGAKWMAGIFLTVVYTAGAMIVMWIGERITESGVTNGISLIIFAGIIMSAGLTIVDEFIDGCKGNYSAFWELIVFVVLTILEFTAIVAVDLSERRVQVNYAKQVKGRKMYGGQSSVIPIKISGSGVMPLIFAFALISFPGMIISLFWPGSSAEVGINRWFSGGGEYATWYGETIYLVTLCILIFAFAFFYSSMQFNPDDVSKTIQQNGGFIQGIRPGKPTADYLRRINRRITLFGAIYLSLVALIPSILSIVLVYTGLIQSATLLSVFSTTGILIVVSVAMQLEKDLEAQLSMKNYKGFLK